MKISYNWLQRHIEEKLPSSNDLKETIIFHAFEVEDMETVGDDTVVDIKVLPDRAGDCLSHYGMAREVAGLLGLTLKKEAVVSLPNIPLSLPVEIKSGICNRYLAVQIDGVQVGPSPKWLVDALEAIGQRPINNVVDATNYILQDLGQPVHAFDAQKIDDGIIIRDAHEGETIITLSEEEKKLSPGMCVIADYVGALAIAGVKGGKTAEVDTATKSIILEIANFDAIATRKTARTLSLQTDASKRFENNLSTELVSNAAQALVALIQDIAGGEVVGVKDIYPKPQEVRTLSFSVDDIARIVGEIIGKQIAEVFDRYKYEYSFTDGFFTLTVPFWRKDITGPHDIAEEVGRVRGYEKIPASSLPFTPTIDTANEYHHIASTKHWLATNGFREVMNYSFVKKGDIEISYGPKGKSALRSNLSDGLKESYEKNKLNMGVLGLSTIRIFEIGTVFLNQGDKQREGTHVATADKGIFEELPLVAFMEKYKIETVSMISPVIYANAFKMWSLYPFITRDIAVWCDSVKMQTTLEEIISAFASQYCVRQPVLFDHFEKDGRTSVAYRLVFQSYEKTLTEEEVEKWFGELVEKIKEEEGFEIR
jgi:phenylalanyl-tRNA synthetase beta chain